MSVDIYVVVIKSEGVWVSTYTVDCLISVGDFVFGITCDCLFAGDLPFVTLVLWTQNVPLKEDE